MTAADLHVLPTHPYLGSRADTIDGLHCDTRAEAERIVLAMVNGPHYEIRECTCPK